ncbi:hypothetical protein Sxan_78500 [Streptomyces xanthophaeus]|uniref:Uncharacterized protein n=2 Tax=Streptomyces xanthophaeus TaxID=67385 RepID=A0A919LGV8_9ACTN|nr:hypothetical protein Sxan_78500 [Streptomyces xanthophaeus]
MRAYIVELERHDWASLRCGCGDSGAHIPSSFTALLEARTQAETIGYTLDGHLERNAMLFQVAPYATPVILAALAEDLPPFTRSHLLNILWYLVTGESHETEVEAGFPGLEMECRSAVAEGIWLIYKEAASGDGETALDILEFTDSDSVRFEHFRSTISRRFKGKA